MLGTNEVVTRKVTPEEARKHGIKGFEIEWFVDANSVNYPTLSVNSQGISFNELAVKEMGIQKGDSLQVGYREKDKALIIMPSETGLKLKTNFSKAGLMVTNKNLVSWLVKKEVSPQRIVIKRDGETWIAEIGE